MSTWRFRGLPSRLWPWAPSSGGPWPSKYVEGQVIEHAIDLEREEIAQPQIQRVFNGHAPRGHLVQCPIPLRELARTHPHAGAPAGPALGVVAPLRQPAAPAAIAHEVRLQPPGQPVLARRGAEAVGDQDQRAIGQRDAVAHPAAALLVEHVLQAQLAPQGARHEHGAPVPRPDRLNLTSRALLRGGAPLAPQERNQVIQMLGQQILAPEAADDPLLVLATLPVGLDQPHVLVLNAFAATGLDRAQEHSRLLSRQNRRLSPRQSINFVPPSVTTILALSGGRRHQITYFQDAPRPLRANMG